MAYPLVRDTFSALGNSKCEALSVLDPKDAFIYYGFQDSKGIVEYYLILGVPHICIKEYLWEDLLKALLKSGLKLFISKKCQLFKTEW